VRREMKGSLLAVMDSLIRGVYVGLRSCHSLLNDAMTKVKAGKMPDFNSEVPFPKPIPQLPTDAEDLPSWFILNWDIIENVIALAATRSPKLATILPTIRAAGEELVKELQHYFSPDHLNKFPRSAKFPDFPSGQLDRATKPVM